MKALRKMNPFFSGPSLMREHMDAAFRAHDRLFNMIHHQFLEEAFGRPRMTSDSYQRRVSESPAVSHRQTSGGIPSNNNHSIPATRTRRHSDSSTMSTWTTRRQNTLAREGINALPTSGSKSTDFAKPTSRSSRSDRHPRPATTSEKALPHKSVKSTTKTPNNSLSNDKLLPVSLGFDWYQESPSFIESGSSIAFRDNGNRFSISAGPMASYLVVYAPPQTNQHVLGVSFEVKMIAESHSLINMVLGYQSVTDFYVLNIDILQQTTTLLHCTALMNSLEELLANATEMAQSSFTLSKDALLLNEYHRVSVEESSAEMAVTLADKEVFRGSFEFKRGLHRMGFLCLKSHRIIVKDWLVHSRSDSFLSTPINTVNNLSTHLNKDLTVERAEIVKQLSPLNALYDKSIVQWISSQVMESDSKVSFQDIAGLDDAKRIINEAVVLPLLMPEFFTGLRQPWKVRK